MDRSEHHASGLLRVAQRHRRLLAIALAVAVALPAVGALAAVARPDAHDRALVTQLNTEVVAFRAINAKSQDDSLQKSLDNCPAFKGKPDKAFAAFFVILPVLLVQVVNDYKPQLTAIHDLLTGMHPDSTLFARWITAQAQNAALILQFDNHGQKVDVCRAATVLTDKKSTPQDIRDTIGIDPSLLPKIFSGSTGSKTATQLNPPMRKFLVAAGLSAKDAKTLTS